MHLHPNPVKTMLLAFIAFTILPSAFWSTLTYLVIDETVAKIVGITFLVSGLYTCWRGRPNNYSWFGKCKKKQLSKQ